MRWDYKLVSYLLLTYFIYGVFNWFSLSDFVVPLPLSFIFAPLIAFTFVIKTKPSIYSILYLAIPLIMLKDLFIYYNENLGIAFIVVSILSWMILGGLLFKESKNNLLTKASAIGLLASPILIIGNHNLNLGYLLIILFTSFKTLQTNNNIKEPLERSLLLFSFINALYLLNETSIWLVG